MSDHLIAEANRHAMALPTTQPTHADIAWCVREIGELGAQLATKREGVRVLHSALQNLVDEQNDAPLETRREQWQMAMAEAGLALAATEGDK